MAYPAKWYRLERGTYLLAGAVGDTAVNAVEFRATGGMLNDAVVYDAGRTFFGWFGGWSTASVPARQLPGECGAAPTATGTAARSAPITIDVDHTAPTAQMLVPDPGATLRGTAVLDAGASDNSALRASSSG